MDLGLVRTEPMGLSVQASERVDQTQSCRFGSRRWVDQTLGSDRVRTWTGPFLTVSTKSCIIYYTKSGVWNNLLPHHHHSSTMTLSMSAPPHHITFITTSPPLWQYQRQWTSYCQAQLGCDLPHHHGKRYFFYIIDYFFLLTKYSVVDLASYHYNDDAMTQMATMMDNLK